LESTPRPRLTLAMSRAATIEMHPENQSYWRLSVTPLHTLVFLLPLIVMYEVGSILYLQNATSGTMRTVGARAILTRFFEAFGAPGLHLPAITLVVVLFTWHVFTREKWRIYPGVLIGMAMESAALVLPLLVLGLIVDRRLGVQGAAPAAGQFIELAGVATADLRALPWQERLTLSIGAGLYEELVFRLVMITAIHALLADVFRINKGTAAVIACAVSAVSFALYHDVSISGVRGTADMRVLVFLTGAGLYFGVLFLIRGFGIVVAVHALYDIVVLVGIASKG
jgi:hypothetical protein